MREGVREGEREGEGERERGSERGRERERSHHTPHWLSGPLTRVGGGPALSARHPPTGKSCTRDCGWGHWQVCVIKMYLIFGRWLQQFIKGFFCQ